MIEIIRSNYIPRLNDLIGKLFLLSTLFALLVLSPAPSYAARPDGTKGKPGPDWESPGQKKKNQDNTSSPCDSFAGTETSYGKKSVHPELGTIGRWNMRSVLLDEERALIASGSFLLAIDTSTGLIDQSFGVDGRASSLYSGTAPLLTADSIYHVGNAKIQKYGLNGDPDLSYGNAGVADLEVDAIYYDAILTADEKVLLGGQKAGADRSDLFLARFNLSDGTLDSTFGSGGTVTLDLGATMDHAARLALLPDGSFLAAGFGGRASNGYTKVQLRKFTADGTLDTTFGQNGVADAPELGQQPYSVTAILVGSAGTITVAHNYTTAGNALFAISQFTASGMPDSNFGVAGTSIAPITSGNFSVEGLIRSSDGSLTHVGELYDWNGDLNSDFVQDFHLTRLTSSGDLDSTFQTAGVLIPTPDDGWERALTLQSIGSEGALLIAGVSDQRELVFGCVNP